MGLAAPGPGYDRVNFYHFFIILTAAFSLFVTVVSLLAGIITFFQNIYFLPIIIACYRYPTRGLVFSAALSLTYFALLILLSGAYPPIVLMGLMNVVIFIGVGSVVAILSERLRGEEEKVRNVVDSQTDLISRTTPDGTHLFVNSAFLTYYNVPHEAVIGKRFQPSMPKSEEIRLQRHFQSLSREHPEGTIETQVILPDTTIRWQSWTNKAIFNEAGVIIAYQSVGRDITDKKQIEEGLVLSETRFRELFNNMSSGVMVFDLVSRAPEVILKDLNLAAERIDQITKQRSIGRTVDEILPWSAGFNLAGAIRRVGETGRPESLPHTRYNNNRVSGWRDIYLYRVPTGEIVMVYDDVTARKLAEDALRESEQRFRKLTDLLPQTVFELDDSLIIVFLNKAGFEILGITPGALEQGIQILDHIAPGDREGVRMALLTIFQESGTDPGISRGRLTGEYMALRSDGKEFPVLIDTSPIVTNHHMTGIRGVMINIEEVKRTEEKILQLSQFRKSVIDDAAIWIDVMDTDMNVAIWNKAAESISGYTQADVHEAGDIWKHLLPERSYRGRIYQEVQQALAENGIAENILTTIRCKGGEEKILLWNIRLMTDSGGTPVASIGMARDITHQEHLEEEKRQAIEQINKNLQQLAILNDHIRNPLQRIVGYADLDDQGRYTEEILASAEEIDAIINQLDLGWLESQKIRNYLKRHYEGKDRL